MRTISTRTFIREFVKMHTEPCLVKGRGRVIGTWQPVADKPAPVDYKKRVKRYCSHPLPFTGAQLLKEAKKR